MDGSVEIVDNEDTGLTLLRAHTVVSIRPGQSRGNKHTEREPSVYYVLLAW